MMDHKTAKLFIKSLISRMIKAGEGSWRLEGPVSSIEYDALRYIAESDPYATLDASSVETDDLPAGKNTDDESYEVLSEEVLNGQEHQLPTENEDADSIYGSRVDPLPRVNKEPGTVDVGILNTELRNFVIPSALRHIQDMLLRTLGDNATLGDMESISDKDLLKGPGVGVLKLKRAREMQQDMLEGKYRVDIIPANESGGDAVEKDIFHGTDDIPLDELEHVLLEGIEQFVSQLDGRDRHVFASRHGWRTPQISLEETGESMPGSSVTRERVRQIQKRLDGDLRTKMPVAPKTLWVNIKSNLSLLEVPLFPRLRACFTKENRFFKFLEICCDVKSGRIISITRPIVKNNILDEYWTQNVSPASVDSASEYMQSEHGFEHAVANNALVRLEKNGVIVINGFKVAPKKLPKSIAYAHVLLLYPSGSDWHDIQGKVNELKVSRTKLPSHRLDSGAGEAVDAGWIYQSDRGEYRSLAYLDLSQEDIDITLSALKTRLEDEKKDARNAINLSVDFYESSPLKLDYFVVRHIARAYGEKEGIFFSGKSGADTVSLDKEFSLASQKKAIVEMFIKSKEPLTKQKIAGEIRSKSVGHASYYIDSLIKENRVVRIEKNAYALAVDVFKGADIPDIVKCAAKLIEVEGGPVGSEILQRHINRELDLEYNKYFYLSLLRIHAPELGYPWYFAQDYVSKRKTEAE
jgi:hypothetical protein